MMAASVASPTRTDALPRVTALRSVWGLRCYIEAVAEVLGVPAYCAGYEVSDTATGYLALDTRQPVYPDRDLMLTWQDSVGWRLATEPIAPTDISRVIAHLAGDVLPTPGVVACFAEYALSCRCDPIARYPAPPRMGAAEPGDLADRLAAYHRLSAGPAHVAAV